MDNDTPQPNNVPPANNQEPVSQTPSPATGFGSRVIQPLDPNIKADTTPTQPLAQTAPATPSLEPQNQVTSPVANTVPNQTVSTPNTPAIHVDGQPVAFSATSQMLQEKHHLPWRRIIKWSLLVVVLAGVGTVLATNQNLRATIFRQKFVTYNYPICKTHICTIEFYRGSKIAPYTPPTPPGQTPLQPSVDLISPIIGGKTYINMRIDTFDIAFANTSDGKQLLNSYSNCSSPGETSGFTEYLSNLDVNANVCAVPANVGTDNTIIGYATVFVSQKAGAMFLVAINENFNINSQGQTTTPIFNLADYQSDMQSVLASLNVKNK